MLKNNFTKKIKLTVYGLMILMLSAQTTMPVNAITLQEVIGKNLPYYVPGDACTIPASGTGGPIIDANAAQAQNIKTIIGIVKSQKLSKKAALIALMTALQESNITNVANTGVPVSLQNPNRQGTPGSDHDSVGVFQQRVSTGWSTYGNGTTQDIVWQLMDVAYSAEAFLGTPPNAVLPSDLKQPSALKKGLQNKVPNFNDDSVRPGVAAQTVQVSAYPDAYDKHEGTAQSFIDKHWDSSPEVPLPIPITAGAPTGTPSNPDQCAAAAASGDLMPTVKLYAWENYRDPDASQPPNAAELARTMKEPYRLAIKAAQERGEYVGVPAGIDCGGFVSRAMRDSKRDPEYGGKGQNTIGQKAYMDSHPNLYKVVSPAPQDTGPLLPGDIAINDVHTFMFVGKISGFNGDAASASQYTRAPMADGTDNPKKYTWYRFIGGQ